MKNTTTGVLKVRPKTAQTWETWFTLVDDDGMPFVLIDFLDPFLGKEVRLTIETKGD